MTTTRTARTEQPGKYTGGNEVFLSFLGTLLAGVDEQLITEDSCHAVIRKWGAHLAQRAGLRGDLTAVLAGFGRMLATLGLTRTFEPVSGKDRTSRVLALKVLDERYVGALRRQAEKPYRSLIALLLEGALITAGLSYSVSESREGMLRDDELLITLSPRS